MNTGASAVLRHYPGPDVTLAVVSNSQDGAWEPVSRLDTAVLG